MNTFMIVENEYKKELNKAYEGMFAQGNGYMSIRGSFEEGLEEANQNEIYVRTMKSVTTEIQRNTLSKFGTYVPTIMGHHPFLMDVIINLPYFLEFNIYINDEKVDMIHSKISNYSRQLNLKDGTLTREVTVTTQDNVKVIFKFERFASMACKHLFVQKVSYEVLEGSGRIYIESGINADITTNGFEHFKTVKLKEEKDYIACEVTTDLDFKVYTVTSMAAKSNTAAQITKEVVTKEGKCIAYRCEEEVKQGSKGELTKYSVMSTSRDLDNILFHENAVQILQEAMTASYEALYEKNKLAWDKKWESADVVVEGNDELQKALRFSIYHLLRSNNEEDYRMQVCAKGFAGEAYYGRYFWDSEIYLLPFYIYTNPEAARNMLLYRYHTLDGARKNAARYHCHGARYPWQSGLTGEEQCSLWEYADNEVHISADIAYAIMHYYKATDDYEFMAYYGAEILLETSRFWVDRVNEDAKGMYHLINVMGPDEYSPMTRDNAFTNRLVQYNLNSAVEMSLLIKEKSPKVYEELIKKLALKEEELEKFIDIANKLPIPYDKERDLYLQSADFEEYGEINIDEIWEDRNKAFGHFVTQEKIYRTKCIKQADVIALMTLFPEEFTDKQVETAYDYYLPYTTHDSSLSPAGHAFVANRIGKEEEGARYMAQTIAVDLSLEKRGTEDGIHIANCGCLWQLVINSFAGVKTARESDALSITPRLPKDIKSLSFPIMWKGSQKRITISENGAVVKVE